MTPSPSPSSTVGTIATCDCPNDPLQCEQLELLPIEQGLMITLHDATVVVPSPSSSSAANADNGTHIVDDPTGENDREGVNRRPRLELRPQDDTNLPQFHPNIYIPSSLLERQDRLVKYGGGGSGVTVFGGYHPLIGNLVMKHGGHRDLVELVSLAKIEREMGVRSKWKVDYLFADGGTGMSQTDHHDNMVGHEASHAANLAAAESAPHEKMNFHLPAIDPTVISHAPADVMKKIQSAQVIKTMGTVMGRIGGTSSMDRLSLAHSRGGIDEGVEEKGGGRDGNNVTFEREAQVRAIQDAAEDMKRRIPAFRMIYISPMHLRERKEELQHNSFRTRGVSIGSTGNAAKKVADEKNDDDSQRRSSSDGLLPASDSNHISIPANDGQQRRIRRHSSVMRKGRNINLFGASNPKTSSVHVHSDSVDLCFGGNYCCWNGGAEEGNADICARRQGDASQTDGGDGYASLMAFANHLQREQKNNDWKITLGQQTIGQTDSHGRSQSAPTASSLLAQGKLHGSLLHHLIDSQIQVIRNLQLLTMPEEVDVVDEVRAEYEDILSRQKKEKRPVSSEEVSKRANAFVGKAIHKNFHPTKGRFIMLRQFGVDLRNGRIHLKPKEAVPAKHLEMLFYQAWEFADIEVEGGKSGAGARRRAMERTFDALYADPRNSQNSSDCHRHHHPMFSLGPDHWQCLLDLSLSFKNSSATDRIWTCGLTDGGLHNMFLSEDQMWLFDLGEPNLEPVPAFLTKFLMSFFHTLGMEEDEKGDWVVRFEQDEKGKLRLTERTREILPGIMEAFNTTMDRIVRELFDGEEAVRVLLLQYVVTQLVSDAAFCIEKWRIKGGGDKQRSEHQDFLEKWLWRALWDVYASEEIRRRYLTKMLFRRQMECRDLSSLNPSVLEK